MQEDPFTWTDFEDHMRRFWVLQRQWDELDAQLERRQREHAELLSRVMEHQAVTQEWLWRKEHMPELVE